MNWWIISREWLREKRRRSWIKPVLDKKIKSLIDRVTTLRKRVVVLTGMIRRINIASEKFDYLIERLTSIRDNPTEAELEDPHAYATDMLLEYINSGEVAELVDQIEEMMVERENSARKEADQENWGTASEYRKDPMG